MTTQARGCLKALGEGEWWVRGFWDRVGCGGGRPEVLKDGEGRVLVKRVCLNLLLLAEKAVSASGFLVCVLFASRFGVVLKKLLYKPYLN